jgi:hypothetical protein
MSLFLLGSVVGLLCNLITAVVSREKALKLIPWVVTYISFHGCYVLLSTDFCKTYAMRLAQRYPSWMSYVIVMSTAAILSGLWWTAVKAASIALATATHHHEPPVPSASSGLTPQLKQDIQQTIREAIQEFGAPRPSPSVADGGIKVGIDALANDLSLKSKNELLSTSRDLKRIVIRNLANAGKTDISDDPAINMRRLEQMHYVPSDWADAYCRFFALEDQLLNTLATNQSEFAALNKWGKTTLRLLKSIQLSSHQVLRADIPLYADEQGRTPIKAVGVQLKETQLSTGQVFSNQIFPTLKNNYYSRGGFVTWEWDNQHQWENAWYRNLSTGKFVKAFDSSFTFNGRHMDEFTDRAK